ncbi:hypothetical protein [Tautonia marina]|uniref:hypothetical protein n=1 Tax=Tautonia marina TaxID=2653855 RepID=UPI001260A7F4|nr:hypothetical protein [Tautonia marina]
MRRSKSMSPKVEGLESLVFLSVTLPTSTVADVSAQSGLVTTTTTEAPPETVTGSVDPAAQSGLVTTAQTPPQTVTGTNNPAAQSGQAWTLQGRPGVGNTARPVAPQFARPIASGESGPIARPFAAPNARPFAAPNARPNAGPAIDLENLDLSSTMRGNYRLQIAPDGSSGSFQLQGIGQVRGIGPARINADYVANASSSPENLTLTVTTRRGTMTLQAGRAPGDADPDASTARLRYQVVDATGALAGAQGSGVVDMTLRPQMRTMGASGQMTMAFRPDVA